MAAERVIPQLARYGFGSAMALFVLSIAWIGSLALAPVAGADASASERISFLADNQGWHIVNFAIVAPMGFVHVPLWLGLAGIVWLKRPACAALVASFGLIYAPFTVIGYWTQLTTVRGIVELHETSPEAAISVFEIMEFSSNFWSWSYGIVVLGYGTWGLAAFAVFAGTVDIPYRLARVTGILFGLAGLLSVVGAIGFIARNQLAELGVVFSGIVFMPALIGAAALLYQVSQGLDLHGDPASLRDHSSES